MWRAGTQLGGVEIFYGREVRQHTRVGAVLLARVREFRPNVMRESND